MKIKDVQKVLDDYNRHVTDYTDQYSNYYTLRRYFEPDAENASYVTDYQLANNIGETCLDSLVEFVMTNMLSETADWVMADMAMDLTKVEQTQRALIRPDQSL